MGARMLVGRGAGVGVGVEGGVERAVERAVEQAVEEGVELEMGQARLSQRLEAQAFRMASMLVKPMGRLSFRVRSACLEIGM